MAYVGVKMLDELYHQPLPSLSKPYGPDPYAPIPAFVDTGVALVDRGNVGQYLQAQSH
jgi:ribose transport system substrate-binding protein